MPIQGIQKITKTLVGEDIAVTLFEARIFREETRAIQRENMIRSGDELSAYTMMMAAPRNVLDQCKVPDVFRRDLSTQSHRRVEKYINLLAHTSINSIQNNGLIITDHALDENVPEEIGLRCIHVTQLFDDQGNIAKITKNIFVKINLGHTVLQQCRNPPAVRHAHCQEHVTTVSPQERRLYDGLATIKNITKNYNLVKVGGIKLKVAKYQVGGYKLLPMSVKMDMIADLKFFTTKWSDICEVFGMTHNIQQKMPTYEFPEEKLTKAFGKPGRQQSWKMVSLLVEEKIDQLYFDKKDTWMNVNLWSHRVGTQQGWTKVNEELFNIPNRKDRVDKSKCRIPNIRTHNESLPFYNADKENVTNGRFIFPNNKVLNLR